MRCRSEVAERFCQSCLNWVCVERCWPGDHINQCWDCLPQRPQPMPNPKPKPKPARVKQDIEEAEATNRWCIFTRKMMRFWRTCWRYAYRQTVDKRIGARRVPPNDWPDVCAPPPLPWDDYEDEPWDVTDKLGIGSDDTVGSDDTDDSHSHDLQEYWGDYVWNDGFDREDA